MKYKLNKIEKEIKKVLKEKDWINQVEIDKKISRHVLEVCDALENLEKKGLVETRPEK